MENKRPFVLVLHFLNINLICINYNFFEQTLNERCGNYSKYYYEFTYFELRI